MPSTTVKLPSVYIDAIGESAFAGLLVVNEFPERNSTEASKSAVIVLEILSTNGLDINASATDVYVNGVLAVTGGVFQSGFSGSVVTTDPRQHVVTIDRTADFVSEELVTVRVVAEDVTPVDTIDSSYTFTVEDLTTPKLSSVLARAATTVRAIFDEGMLSQSSAGANDALNPANYTLVFVPVNDRQAGAGPTVVSVNKVNDLTYDLATDFELSFFRTYRLVVGAVADDSAAGNTVLPSAPDNQKEFASWSPPGWPSNRKFDFFTDLLSRDDRTRDVQGDLERLASAFTDTISLLCWDVDRWIEIIDLDDAPSQFVDAMLFDLGNPFDFDLSDNRKRKLADLLPDIYKQRGTEAGIRNLARFFLGIEITDIEIWNEDGWILGVSELGIDTDLALGIQANLYTFIVHVDQDLDATTRRQLEILIELTKVAHEHFIIKTPSDLESIDHLALGFSELGVNWTLH